MRSSIAFNDEIPSETSRSGLRSEPVAEEVFRSVLTDICRLLYPPPKTAMYVAELVGCSTRNIEACMGGKQRWSGDAVAAIVAEVLRRHGARNFKIASR